MEQNRKSFMKKLFKKQSPKVLLIDIETAPLLGYCWGLFENNVSLNQIFKDTYLLSYSAKWLNEKKVFYKDQRNKKNIEDDKDLLKEIWKLMDEADIIVGQNSKSFDVKRINARFAIHGMKPPSSFKQIDTLRLAKKHFAFTSNKLEYLTNKLNKKHKKSTHKEFNGFELWKECLLGNIKAWKEMEKYNKLDVLSLEELYHILIPWDSSINFNLYTDSTVNTCKCGSTEFKKYGFAYTSVGKYQRYQCKKCGSETRDRTNLFDKEKQQSLKIGTIR